jgi:hypothetical protein
MRAFFIGWFVLITRARTFAGIERFRISSTFNERNADNRETSRTAIIRTQWRFPWGDFNRLSA